MSKRTGWKRKSGLTYRQSPKWKQIRLAVLKRDGFQCTAINGNTNERCTSRATDVDHIKGHSDDPDNLASLCAHHHRAKTSAETYEKNKARRDAVMLQAGEAVRSLAGGIVPREKGSISAGIDWEAFRALGKKITGLSDK